MRQRNTARAVLFDPLNRVLLFEFVLPPDFIAGVSHFWATPGGEIEPGEDVLDAIAREVREETGIEGVELGAELWYGSNQLIFKGEPVRTLERFFLVRSPTSSLGATNWTELEKQVMRSHRWWTPAELIAAKETIFPPRFGELVEHFLIYGSTGPQEIPL
jgi:8-oxo-dGTP pyrophosphatase MutT (NUDIX family)